MRGDGRSRRVAVVADAVANPPPGSPDTLVALADGGWGVVVLPPGGLDASSRDAWLGAIVDQIVTFLGDGYEVALLPSADGETARFEDALRRAGAPRPRVLQLDAPAADAPHE